MRTALVILGITAALRAEQAPNILNGRVESRPGTIAAVLSALPSSDDPVWLAWRVPLIAGDRELCGNWVSDRERIRGAVLEGARGTSGRPVPTPSSTSINLNAGSSLVVLMRAVNGRPERVRTVADDCPIDASGQTVHWLADVTPAASLSFLESLATERGLGGPTPQNIHDAAISAIALHRDTAADASLDRLTRAALPSGTRATAARWLVNARGEHGFDKVSALIREEPDARARVTFVAALWRSTSPRTAAALLALARSDAEPTVRSEAASGYAKYGAEGAVEALLELLGRESNADVRARLVNGLDLVPNQMGLPALLNLARASTDPRLKKEAVRALSRSADPRATAYLEDVLRQP